MNRDYGVEKAACADVLTKAVNTGTLGAGLARGYANDPFSAGIEEGRRQMKEELTPKPDANLSFKTATTEVKALRDVNGNFLAAVRRVGPGRFSIETASYTDLTPKSIAEIAIFLTNAAADMSEEEALFVEERDDSESSDNPPAPKRTMSAATRAKIAATMKRKRAEQLKAAAKKPASRHNVTKKKAPAKKKR